MRLSIGIPVVNEKEVLPDLLSSAALESGDFGLLAAPTKEGI